MKTCLDGTQSKVNIRNYLSPIDKSKCYQRGNKMKKKQEKFLLLFIRNAFSSRLVSKNFEIKMYKTTIWLWNMVTYMRRECKLRVFENKILRSISGPKKHEIRLHYEELFSLYRSSNRVKVVKSRRIRWARHVSRTEEGRSAFKI